VANGDVDAQDVAAPLADDRVHRERGLAGAPVADDQLALAAADGKHCIDHQGAGLQRLTHQVAINNRRRRTLHGIVALGRDRAAAIERQPQRVEDAAQEGIAHRGAHDLTRAMDIAAGHDMRIVAQQQAADRALAQLEGQSRRGARHDEKFVGARAGQPGDQGHPVTHALDPADLLDARRVQDAIKTLAQRGTPSLKRVGERLRHRPSPRDRPSRLQRWSSRIAPHRGRCASCAAARRGADKSPRPRPGTGRR
jgi:hypothetical protein